MCASYVKPYRTAMEKSRWEFKTKILAKVVCGKGRGQGEPLWTTCTTHRHHTYHNLSLHSPSICTRGDIGKPPPPGWQRWCGAVQVRKKRLGWASALSYTQTNRVGVVYDTLQYAAIHTRAPPLSLSCVTARDAHQRQAHTLALAQSHSTACQLSFES